MSNSWMLAGECSVFNREELEELKDNFAGLNVTYVSHVAALILKAFELCFD